MATAVSEAQDLQPGKVFRLMQGDRFLELSPVVANKAAPENWVLQKLTPADAIPVYIGDDDKDEEAFAPVLAAGGYAVRVTSEAVKTSAPCRSRTIPGACLDKRNTGYAQNVRIY